MLFWLVITLQLLYYVTSSRQIENLDLKYLFNVEQTNFYFYTFIYLTRFGALFRNKRKKN